MLRAGFAAEAITPPPGCSLIGYDFRQKQLPAGHGGVHDPLFARALALGDGTTMGVILSLDLCVVHRGFARALRQAVAERIDIDPEHVMVACTHTHSGPYPVSDEEREALNSADGDINAWLIRMNDDERAYPRQVLDAATTAAARAAGKMYAVEARTQEAPLGIGYNRRVPDGHGGVSMCWSPSEQEHLDPAGAPDPTLTVLELRQIAGPRRFILFSIGAHGTVMGKTFRQVSGDWPAAACRLIEQYEPESRAMFLFGACGNVHPWIATQEDPRHTETVGRAAAAMVSLLTHATRAAADDDAVALAVVADHRDVAGAPMDLAAWRIGPTRIIAAPVELFGELSMDVRAAIDGPLMFATCANGFEGYWPTRAAFEEGGYEVDAARRSGRAPGDGETLRDALIEQLRGLETNRA